MKNTDMLGICVELVKFMDSTADDNLPREIVDIVKFHSKGAAIAALAAGWIPAAGATAAVVISGGFVWTMYGRINKKIGLSITENIVKSLASGVATNLAVYAVSAAIFSTVFSLFPGIGSAASSTIIAGTCYALTLASGYVYLKILVNLFKAGKDPSSMSAEGLKKAAKEVVENEDIKGLMKKAKTMYKEAKERGEIKEEKAQAGNNNVKKCSSCGGKVQLQAVFCTNCGKRFEGEKKG